MCLNPPPLMYNNEQEDFCLSPRKKLLMEGGGQSLAGDIFTFPTYSPLLDVG